MLLLIAEMLWTIKARGEWLKNVLLILDNSLEFDFAKTILSKLGFNVLYVQEGVDLSARLLENFPDLVITSVVGNQDRTLQEFMKIRDAKGIPKFIWVGPDLKMRQLSAAQLKVIDATLQRPLQPELLIRCVCDLLDLQPEPHVKNYRSFSSENIYVSGDVKTDSRAHLKASKYDSHLAKIERVDKVFSLKELSKRNEATAGSENSPELSLQKKDFLKKLFKK